MKSKSLRIVAAVCFLLAALTYAALGAGPATNVVTLDWTQQVSTVPYFTEVHQSTNLTTWVVITNLPSTTTQLTLSINKDPKYWMVRNVNSTNTAFFSDFSNQVGTAWPPSTGNLSIRLGP